MPFLVESQSPCTTTQWCTMNHSKVSVPLYISVDHIACAVPGCTEVSAPEKEGEGLRKRERCAWSVKMWQGVGASFKCLTVSDNYKNN